MIKEKCYNNQLINYKNRKNKIKIINKNMKINLLIYKFKLTKNKKLYKNIKDKL